MLNSFFKQTIALKLKGIQPMPSDEELSLYVYEAITYIATRTTPKSHIIRFGSNSNEMDSLRSIEQGFYLRLAEVPDFTGAEPTEVIDIDEELTYACAYYTCFIISKAKSGVPTPIKAEYLSEAQRLIALFDSNLTRAGSTLYDNL